MMTKSCNHQARSPMGDGALSTFFKNKIMSIGPPLHRGVVFHPFPGWQFSIFRLVCGLRYLPWVVVCSPSFFICWWEEEVKKHLTFILRVVSFFCLLKRSRIPSVTPPFFWWWFTGSLLTFSQLPFFFGSSKHQTSSLWVVMLSQARSPMGDGVLSPFFCGQRTSLGHRLPSHPWVGVFLLSLGCWSSLPRAMYVEKKDEHQVSSLWVMMLSSLSCF